MIRKESQNKVIYYGRTYEQKIQFSNQLEKLITHDQPFNMFHTLFGFIIGYCHVSIFQRVALQIKNKFSFLQQLYQCKTLNRQGIFQIIVESISQFQRQQGRQIQKQQRMLISLQQSVQQMAMNQTYIISKWQKQQRLMQENKVNQLALKKLLQQQAKQYKMKAEQIQSQGWQCPVCLTEIDRQNFGILQCSHIFHPQCINAYLKSKIQSSEVEIICPMQGCGKHVEVGDIYNYIDGNLKQKYEKFTFNKFIQSNGASTAWCPTAGCSAAFQFDVQLDNYKCPACKKHYCLKCRCDYHYGMTCAEYRINNSFDKNDEQFVKFVQGAKYKQCPKCKHWVQRQDGCSTMTCRCGQEFCYLCGGTTCPHGMCNVYPQGEAIRPIAMPFIPRRPMPAPRIPRRK